MARTAGPIAIDFGAHAVRVAQAPGRGMGRPGILLDRHEFVSRPRGERPAENEIIEAVGGLIRRNGFRGRRVVTALSARDMTVKNIRLPQMPPEELESAVQFEAQERIPGLDGEAEIRFYPVGVLPGRSDAQQEVIVLAVTGPVLREHLRIIEALGLESAGLDSFASAVVRPFLRRLRRDTDGDRVTAVVDIGRSGMRFMLARGRGLVFAKSFDWGGEHLDALAAERAEISFVKASALRRQTSMARRTRPPDYQPAEARSPESGDEATRSGWEQIAKEIGLCLRYYAVTFRGLRPAEVICVGGESMDPSALALLSQLLGTPCRAGRPLFEAGWEAQGSSQEGASESEWTTAVGLALRPLGRAVGAGR